MINIFKYFNQFQSKNLEVTPEKKDKIVDELIRQTQLTFNLAFGITTASAIITLLGVGLFYCGKMPEASLTAGTGILASIGSFKSAKDARGELKEMLERSGTTN